MTIHDAIRDLERACRTLQAEQGRLARANARTRVKRAVKRVIATMDEEFPLIRKERVIRASMTPIAKKRRERARRLRTFTSTVAVSNGVAVSLIALGVRVVKNPDTRDATKPFRAPPWAVKAYEQNVVSHQAIKQATRSTTARRKIEALLRLRQPAAP
jgi:hypothetical protein